MAPKLDRPIAPWRERADQRTERALRRWEVYLLVASACAGAVAALVAGLSTLVGGYQAYLSRKQLQITRLQTIQSTRPFVDVVFSPDNLSMKGPNNTVDLFCKYVNYGHGPALEFKSSSYLIAFDTQNPPYVQMPEQFPLGDDIPPDGGYYPIRVRMDEFFKDNEQLFKSGRYIGILKISYSYKDIYGNPYNAGECFVVDYSYKYSAVSGVAPCASLAPRDHSGRLIDRSATGKAPL